MMSHDNTVNVLASGVSTLPSMLLLITQADVPLWLYIVTAVLMPLVVGFGSKALDRYWKLKDESKK
jgi:hypothetical protein